MSLGVWGDCVGNPAEREILDNGVRRTATVQRTILIALLYGRLWADVCETAELGARENGWLLAGQTNRATMRDDSVEFRRYWISMVVRDRARAGSAA